MVRRKSLPRGVANQLQMQLMTSSPTAAQYGGWLQHPLLPHVARNYQTLHWQQQAQPSISRLCNKMVGCMPRLPTLPQPEVSSRKLRRLRRSLMSWQPEVLRVPQRTHMLPQPVALPQWCRAPEQHGRQPQNVSRTTVASRQSGGNQCRQQQQVQQMWQQQQQQRWQQPQRWQQQQRWQQSPNVATSAATKQNNLKLFNFGECAESFLNFPSAIKCGKPVANTFQAPLKHYADFNYVKAAKQMVQPATDCGKKRLCSKESAELKLTCGNETSTTTLTNSSENSNEQVNKTFSQNTLRSSDESLNQLATDIDLNLTAIRQLLEMQLAQKGARQINSKLDSLATLLQQQNGVNSKPETLESTQSTNEPLKEPELKTQPQIETVKSSFEQKAQRESVLSLRSSNEQSPPRVSAGTVKSSANVGTDRSSCEQNSQRSSVVSFANSSEQTSPKVSAGTLKSSFKRPVQSIPAENIKSSYERQAQMESAESVRSLTVPETSSTSKIRQTQRNSSDNINSSNKRSIGTIKSSQLNLNKLFQPQNLTGSESNPMWQSLMQLATHMVENKDESREKPPKQYSIYLMVSSDDENEPETDARDAQQIRHLSALMQPQKSNSHNLSYNNLKYGMPENFAEPSNNLNPYQYQLPKVPKKKKRNKNPFLISTLPPRRPLHWPKQDFSKPFTKKSKKLMCSSKKLSLFANPLQKFQYRWS